MKPRVTGPSGKDFFRRGVSLGRSGSRKCKTGFIGELAFPFWSSPHFEKYIEFHGLGVRVHKGAKFTLDTFPVLNIIIIMFVIKILGFYSVNDHFVISCMCPERGW